MKVIVINDALKQKHIELIENTAHEVGAQLLITDSEKSIPEDFKDAEVLYGFGMKTAATSKNLKWLCVPSAGVDFLMKPGSFANEECLLTNSSGSYGVSIAEHIIAVSLMMMRRLTEFHRETLSGEWGSPRAQKSLKDARITVLGTGDIGSCFARRAVSFEPASLVGVNRSGNSSEDVYDRIYKVCELDKVLPATDLLVMSLPATAETEGILSRERIDFLPEGAYVVNVGRGSAIDEDALADALDSGKLGGAALDVFVTEPLPKDSRLWHTKNLLITPHVAGNLTIDYTIDRNVEMFCEDLLNYAEGRPLKNLVDRNIGY
ncbi:MAG: D-2-hydroxyacid dehydrogenase [Lachnospiraceae bacterium]|nr:D-2-hydroxyacid dehydrogenase [Lachnospiraceae bacterium]